MSNIKNVTIEDARLLGGSFRNFSGKATKFTPEGVRTFCVALDPMMAERMRKDGWNVRQLKPRDEDEDPLDYIQVKVNFEHRPPKIVLINGRKHDVLDEDGVNILDWAELERVDLVLSPYEWGFGGKSGVKAYLKSMYATLAVDALDAKYNKRFESDDDDDDDDILSDGETPF